MSRAPDAVPYAELQAVSNFSFLRGASHAEELVEEAARLGLAAIGIADRNTLAGAVRAHVAAKRAGIRLLTGARLDLDLDLDRRGGGGLSLLCYPRDRAAWGRLCRLLTLGQRRAGKGECVLHREDLLAHAEGQVLIALPPEPSEEASGGNFEAELAGLRRAHDGPLYLAAHMLYRGGDRARLGYLAALAERSGAPLLATNDVHYHRPGRRPLQDVLTAIREHVTVAEAGLRLAANAERHLKDGAEIARLFRGHEAAVARSLEVAGLCSFSLDEIAYEYPDEPVPAGRTPQRHLEALAWQGARWRYPDGVPERVAAALRHELGLIGELDYAPYFLTVHDIVRFAGSKGILCQGRGSAANSAVCYCLGITAVDPVRIDLLFERFVSRERREPPDIDVDFEHERREEVIQYIYGRYGRERAGIAATVISYRARSAVRDVGKAMGLSEDVAAALAAAVRDMHREGVPEKRLREAELDPTDPLLRRTVALATELQGFPRHLSQHVGGFVLTRGRLDETVPVGNAAMKDRTFIEWDKDDLEALGLMKVDVLGLGMLTCIRKAFELLAAHKGLALTLATVPAEDGQVYDMICRADTIGVFQIESRAQMNMLPRLRPRSFYDLVIEVAIVRPGPIQGDMVHPYLRRRDGLEAVVYPAPAPEHGPPDELRKVLEKTLGVPLFQEQAMRVAMEAARFTPDEADALRHAMATFRKRGTLGLLRDRMVGRMTARGYDPELAARCFRQIEGFGDYGFPESHAASFALLAWVSSWLKCRHPEVFACALLNAQPMGFYAPAQIVRDAREHGVDVRPADVHASGWDNSLERLNADRKAGRAGGRHALRLGLRQIADLRKEDADRIIAARGARPWPDIAAMQRESGIGAAAIETLAAADAFGSMGLDRRGALWQASALANAAPLPLFEAAAGPAEGAEPPVPLPAMAPGEQVVEDYRTLRLSLRAHPLAFLRARLAQRGVLTAGAVAAARDGQRAAAAGLVLVRQRPGSASGVIFMTLEDETGVVNIVVWPRVLERFRKAVLGARLALVRGRVQRAGEIVHLVADRLEDLTGWLDLLTPEDGAGAPPPAPGPVAFPSRHPRNLRTIPKSRDFR
ncbi:MAG: error-prone DNA polymerase [Rhodospirillaceae bacterium]|nr:error-prone DNA polymerase [Rhodospirillaceae bacterium]MYB11932.1 error-prone DNA polymerase [Rhodospirillaceae bacterium]MYI48641.1 error-prone DNA polymerase [Rhodospirillaceae bacterium]